MTIIPQFHDITGILPNTSLTSTKVEASTDFTVGSVPDPLFPTPI